MSGAVVGNPVNAVLIPPQAEGFASLVSVDLDTLELNVTGWNKLVLLAVATSVVALTAGPGGGSYSE